MRVVSGQTKPQDFEYKYSFCRAKKAGEGYAKGDLLCKRIRYNAITDEEVGLTWTNLTQAGAVLAAAPAESDLLCAGGSANVGLSNEKVAVADAAVGLTVPAEANCAVIHVHNADIMHTTVPGGVPTTANAAAPCGFNRCVNDTIFLEGDELANFNAIAATAGLPSNLYVEYFCKIGANATESAAGGGK